MKIELTKDKWAIVDDRDAQMDSLSWHYGSNGYAMGKTSLKNGSKSIAMHREIMQAKPGQEVDHINGNRLDNRRSNLRICTRIQNAQNMSKRKRATSIYKGVSWEEFTKRYRAVIYSDRRYISIGRFKTEEDAARAYNAAAIQYHGEFAKLNEI